MRGRRYGLVAVAVVGFGAGPALGVNWLQTYHDAGHKGVNTSETVLSTANVANLQSQWGQSVDCGTVALALNAGTIYALGQGDCNGNWDLTSIDAATGTKGWTVVTGNAGNFPVVAAGQLVFSICGFVNDTAHSVGAICAYRKSNGKRVWRWSNECHCLPESGVQSALAYANGVVYFGYGNGGSGGAEYVVAADAATGNAIWTYVTGTSNSLGTSPIAVGDGGVYFGCNGANNFHGLCSVAQSDGSLRWAADMLGANVGAVTSANGTVYANPSFGASSVIALDAATGAQKWSFGAGQTGNRRPVAVRGANVYYTDDDGYLYDLRAADGTVKWSILTGINAASSPSLANGVLYVDGSTHWPAVSAYNASNGNLLWSTPGTQGGLFPPPMIADGVLYDTNDSSCGNICAYALPGGTAHR